MKPHRIFPKLKQIINEKIEQRLRKEKQEKTVISQEELYQKWLDQRIEERRKNWNIKTQSGLFSLLTGIYEKTPPDLFQKTAESILNQSYSDFQWVILKHGFIPESLQFVVKEIIEDPRITYLDLEENLGIMGGMAYCLKFASNEYIIPMDADDLLTVDALECLAHTIIKNNFPSFIYSDEDILINDQPQSPYFRGDWDPILNLSSSYIWHLCCFRRQEAIALGVYSDLNSNWCHDWDTLYRFSNNNITPFHIPEILYHWRHHVNSSTNRPDPESGSLASQRHLLELQINKNIHPENFEVKLFPLDRGSPEWYIYRKPIKPENLQVILFASSSQEALNSIKILLKETNNYPFSVFHIIGIEEECLLKEINNIKIYAWQNYQNLREIVNQLDGGLTLIYHSCVKPLGDRWPWEILTLKEFHQNLVLFSGRIINEKNIVLAGGEIFNSSAIISPFQGKSKNDPTEYALALKPHCCSAVNSHFCIVETDFLKIALPQIPEEINFNSLGYWLGAIAALEKKRVAFSPLITAELVPTEEDQLKISIEDQQQLRHHYANLFPDDRFLSQSYLLWHNEQIRLL